MFRVILLAIFVLSVWYWWRKLKGLSISERRAFVFRSAIWVVLAIALGLAATGKMHWIGAGLAALLPLFSFLFKWGRRALPIMRILGRFKTIPSQITTKTLTVTQIISRVVHRWFPIICPVPSALCQVNNDHIMFIHMLAILNM